MEVLKLKWIAILNSEDNLKDRPWPHIQPESRKAGFPLGHFIRTKRLFSRLMYSIMQ